jgi:hypothetical protein
MYSRVQSFLKLWIVQAFLDSEWASEAKKHVFCYFQPCNADFVFSGKKIKKAPLGFFHDRSIWVS